jgi:hypothetical protein
MPASSTGRPATCPVRAARSVPATWHVFIRTTITTGERRSGRVASARLDSALVAFAMARRWHMGTQRRWRRGHGKGISAAQPPCGETPTVLRRGSCCVALALTVAVAACGSSGARSSGHLPLPQLADQGGGLLTAPKIVSITFSDDPMAPQLQTFGASITSSAWWNTVRPGYCEGSGGPCLGDGSLAAVELSTAAAATYSDSTTGGPSTFQQWLASAVSSGQLPPPGPGAISNTLYVVYLPQTTTITLDGVASCSATGFGGYHNIWQASGSQLVPYAVIDECAPLSPQFPNVPADTVLQDATINASHEILEAASDPNPPTGYALDGTNPDNWGWLDVTGGGEAGDMCEDLLGLNQDQTSDGSFTVQRIWSSSRAAAGLDPCNPAPAGDVYFNAAPRQAFFVLDVGASASFDVDAFSSAAMKDWTLMAQDWSDSATITYLTFSIDGATTTKAGPSIQVNNGSTVHVTVTLTREPGALDTGEADGAIVSFSGDPARPAAAHMWPIAVMSTADAMDAGVGPGTTVVRRVRRPRRHFADERALLEAHPH